LFGPEFAIEGLVIGCGALILKSIKRRVINIRCSILDVRCLTFNLFAVQTMLGDLCSKFDHKGFSDEMSGLLPAADQEVTVLNTFQPLGFQAGVV